MYIGKSQQMISGWNINTGSLFQGTYGAANIELNSANKYIAINSSAFGSEGIQLQYNSGTPRFYVGDGSNKHLKYDGTDVDIKTDTFVLDTTNLDISSAAKRVTINDGSADRIYLGEVDGGSVFGMKIFDGTGTADSDIMVEFGQGGNKIAGWTIDTETITEDHKPDSVVDNYVKTLDRYVK